MKILLFFVLILFPILVFGQQWEYYDSFFLVSIPNGLEVKELPSLNSRIITILENGQIIKVTRRTLQYYTIDGINDYWYFVFINDLDRFETGWVFGGYLTDIYEDYDDSFLVSAPNGLVVRELPTLNSKIISILNYGESIRVYGRTLQCYTIDGINDYLYFIWIGLDRFKPGWIFGGYLTDILEHDPIVGYWVEENDFRNIWGFMIDKTFSGQINRTGSYVGGYNGKYELDENNNGIITLNIYNIPNNGKIQFINNNRLRLTLTYSNETIILLRVKNIIKGEIY